MTEPQGPVPHLLAELATLGSLARAAGHARTSEETASAALDILARSTAADAGVVLYDGGGGFEVAASFGFPPGAIEALVGDRSVSDQLAAALNATPGAVTGPLASAPIRPEVAAALAAHGLRSILAAPLRISGHLIGLLGLGWRDEDAPMPPEATIVNASTIVAATLENAHLVEQLQRTLASERRLADEEATLQSLTLIAETAGAFDELAATTVRQVMALFGATAGSYALITDDDRVVHSASVGIDRPFIQSAITKPASGMVSVRRLLDGSGPYLRAYETGSVDPATLEMARKRHWTAFALLPITVRDRLHALIALFFEHPPDVPDLDRTMSAISRIASISLANFRLRERLQASETRYRVLFEGSPDAIVLMSTNSELIDANPAALRLYRTDLAGLRQFVASGGPAVSDEERKRRAEVLARDGRGTFRDIGVRPDGSSFPDEVSIVRVEIGGDQRYLVIVRDLTEQDRLQDELLQAQKMEAIGQLVSGVAHELNNPLAAIVAFSQLLRGDPRLPEDMRRDAELLVQEADRTRRIVQSLLDFARQRPPERHPTALSALVDSVLALQSYSLSAGQIALTVDVPPDLPLIEVDRSQLQQVLLNLTLNAIQAIRAERPSGHIWLTARRVGTGAAGLVRLSVADDGPGIPEALRPRLFLPFFTTKAPGEGTGLGLSVSFGIVASHDGSLRFEPRSGGGATFVLELPVASRPRSGTALRPSTAPSGVVPPSGAAASSAPAAASGSHASSAAPAPSPAAPAQTAATARPRVLVLDDEPAIRAFLTKCLRLVGIDAVSVGAGEQAVERCRTEPFDAILVDHRMPGMSGTDVYEAVAAIRPELAERFVFMSGDILNPDLRRFAASHAVELLAKPFDVDTVNGVVLDVIARHPEDGADATDAESARKP